MARMKKVARRKRGEVEEAPPSNSIDQRHMWLGGLGILFLLAIVGLVFLTRPATVDTAIYESINSDTLILGNPDAPILIRDFADFKCPHCKQATTTLIPSIIEEYVAKGTVRLEVVPVAFRDESSFGGQAALCADDQGQFWPYHDLLFEQQAERFTIEQLLQFGRDLDMDDQELRDCIVSGKYRRQMEENLEEFRNVGGTGTPTFVVGDETLASGVPAFSAVEESIAKQLE
ncbi:MAG: DsbA family protein [Ardenticatenaceae bacterium]